MFLGTFEATLIGHNRLVMPAKLKREIGSQRLVLTIGFEKCIFGFRENDWEQAVAPEFSRPFFSDDGGRNLRRRIGANALMVDLDSQGRFVMPEKMAKFAGITSGGVTLIGAGDHFEIWEKSNWDSYMEKMGKDDRIS